MNKATPYVDFSKEFTVASKHREEFDLPSPMSVNGGDYKYQHSQGGCYAKGILYSIMHAPTNPPKCCIYKHDAKTGEYLGHSQELEIGHANDATYNPEENTIVVSYCDGTTRMAILDADTLEYKETVTLEGHVLCNIDYNPKNEIYVAVAVQCEAVYVYDKNFKLINSFKAFMTPGEEVEYSMQGCLTDGVYVYVLEWHGGKKWGELRGRGGATMETSTSHFKVFDLKTGEHMGIIDTRIPLEIEYAARIDGKFLVGCNNIRWSGLEVWEMEISQ